MRRTLFDLLLCTSLFNLLLLRVWAQLLPAVVNPANLYYMEVAPNRSHYLLVPLTLFAVSAGACAAGRWARRSESAWPRRAARVAFIALGVLALNAIAGQFEWSPFEALGATAGSGIERFAVLAALAGLIGVAWFRASWLIATTEVLALVALPFLAMTIAQAGYGFATHRPDEFMGERLDSDAAAGPVAARAADAPRLVWILFDELDQRALFTARPERLRLREFDRLRSQSFVATNAYSPARETRLSIASLLLDREVSYAMPNGASTMPCSFDGRGSEAAVDDCWQAAVDLFAKLRERGVNAGVAGWYHPYCRLFADRLSTCHWAGLPYWNSGRFGDSFDQQWHEVVKAIPLARDRLRPGRRIRAAHVDAYRRISEAALDIASDPDIGFAFLHLPVPHHPDIFDPIAGELSTADSRSYFDNLELADRALGEIREAMEGAGLWKQSIVIVTSDHWWRAIHRGDWGLTPEEERVFDEARDQRVPLLVKFAGQRAPAVYRKAFNTRLLHPAALEMLAGGIESPAGLAEFLDRRRAEVPVRYLATRPAAPRNPSRVATPRPKHLKTQGKP